MLLPVSQMAQLVTSLNLDWINKIYTNAIPQEERDNSDETVMLLQETESSPSDYANQAFKGMLLGVEIQIFYKTELEDDFNPLEAEMGFMQALKDDGWTIVQSQAHSTDPDTNQVTKTIYVTKDKLI